MFLMTGTAYNYAQEAASDPIANSIETAHSRIWSDFMDLENGLIYDYVNPNGPTDIPSPDDCKRIMPNALSWWVPTENGAFFNGIYLQAICRQWQIRKDNESEFEARKLVSGLRLLATVGDKGGFIARGVSTDGVSHFPLSSTDQTYPWFYGLWKYSSSGMAGEMETKGIVSMMEYNATFLEDYNWQIPSEGDVFGFFGGFAGPSFSSCARLLSILQFMYQLTENDHWADLYDKMLYERLQPSGKTRLEILNGGIPYDPSDDHHSFWTSSMDQAALRELYLLEKRDKVRSLFKQGLDLNARNAAKHIVDYKTYNNKAAVVFNPDWRLLNSIWRPHKSWNEAWELADEQLELWDSISPRKGYELSYMMEPLNAAWIVVLSGNREIIGSLKHHINNALTHYDWSTMSYSTFFMAECVYYTF